MTSHCTLGYCNGISLYCFVIFIEQFSYQLTEKVICRLIVVATLSKCFAVHHVFALLTSVSAHSSQLWRTLCFNWTFLMWKCRLAISKFSAYLFFINRCFLFLFTSSQGMCWQETPDRRQTGVLREHRDAAGLFCKNINQATRSLCTGYYPPHWAFDFIIC